MYLLKLALRPWRRAAWIQIFSILSFSFLTFMMALMLWTDRELKPLVSKLKTEQVLTLYVASDVPSEEEGALIDSIRTNVGAAPEVKMVSSQDFLEEMKRSYPELVQEVMQLGDEMKSAVPKYVSVMGLVKPEQLQSLRSIKGVESIEVSHNKLRSAAGPFQSLRLFAKVVILGMLSALICSWLLLGKVYREIHQDAVTMMGLMGASTFEKKLPLAISGLILGAGSGVVSALMWWAMSPWLILKLKGFSPVLESLGTPPAIWALGTVLVCMMIGMTIGSVGLGGRKLARATR